MNFNSAASGSALWHTLRQEARQLSVQEPCLARLMDANVLAREDLGAALAYRLAHKLSCEEVSAACLEEVMRDMARREPGIAAAAAADLQAVHARDPACASMLTPLLHFSGYLALQTSRFAHHLWRHQRRALALQLQSRASQVFGVDIHPAARIGQRVMIDHAISVVIGETAVVEDDVSMLHEVTLGGRRSASGDRHPKVRRGVTLCAGAKVLGNVELGPYCVVGAGSVVLDDVPAYCTVAGVPARVVCLGRERAERHARGNPSAFEPPAEAGTVQPLFA